MLFHLSILGVFLLMQILSIPSLLLFFYKFFPFFFCKEGLKEIQPPSQCFWPLWTWFCLDFQIFVCIMHFSIWFVLCFRIVCSYARRFTKLPPLHYVFGYLQVRFKELQPLHNCYVYWRIEFKELWTPLSHNFFASHCVYG